MKIIEIPLRYFLKPFPYWYINPYNHKKNFLFNIYLLRDNLLKLDLFEGGK